MANPRPHQEKLARIATSLAQERPYPEALRCACGHAHTDRTIYAVGGGLGAPTRFVCADCAPPGLLDP
jgi:spermidine synthase